MTSENPDRLKPDQRIIRAAFTTLLLVILIVSLLFNPDQYRITDCAFKNMTGVSCPGCGLTHSFHATANLNFIQGFSDHILGPIFFAGFVILFVIWSFEAISGKKTRLGMNKIILKTLIYSTLLIWAGYWVIRMIYVG